MLRFVALSPTHRFTVKDYHRMAQAGVFAPEDRVELLDGKVFDLAPIGSRHAACVKRLARAFMGVGDRAIVSIQDPVQLSELSEPQPDVALLRPRTDYYATGHSLPRHILLVAEVAEATARHDLTTKLPLYLAAGIPEVWVVDLNAEVVHVVTSAGTQVLSRRDSVAPQAFPDLVIEVTSLVG